MAEQSGIFVTREPGGLRDLDKIIVDAVKNAMQRQGEFLAERAKQNAPIDKGPLRDSIEPRLTEKNDGIEVLLVAGMDYALRMHEELTPFGPLNLGPNSQLAASQPIPEGGPGGKYLARAVDFNIAKVQKAIGDALADTIKVEISTDRPGFHPRAFFPRERYET